MPGGSQQGGGVTGGGPGGGSGSVSSEVTAWVRKHGTAVKESAYSRSSTPSASSGSTSRSNRSTIYRLDPSDGN